MDTLSALLASGTDEDSALALCIEQTRHKKLHKALEKCREETQMGVGIATAFAHQKILPAMYGKMLLGGAQSGELVQVTENLARLGWPQEARKRVDCAASSTARADFDRISHRVCRFDAFKRHAALARHFERNLREKLWVF